MSYKAKEIQRLWSPQIGDFYYLPPDEIKVWGCDEAADLSDLEKIWLPRQDQLQEIVLHPALNTAELPRMVLKFNENAEYWYSFDSFEQLWLAFLMYENFKKIWDEKREEWVKIEQ